MEAKIIKQRSAVNNLSQNHLPPFHVPFLS